MFLAKHSPPLISYHGNNEWPILKLLISKDDLYTGLKSHKVLWRSAKLFLRYLAKTLRGDHFAPPQSPNRVNCLCSFVKSVCWKFYVVVAFRVWFHNLANAKRETWYALVVNFDLIFMHQTHRPESLKSLGEEQPFWLTDRPKASLWVNAITCAEIAPVGCCLGEPTCNSSSMQGHTDEYILTIQLWCLSSNQPFTAIEIPWHSCVEQVNNEISGLSSLRWRCAVRLRMSLDNQHGIGLCNLCAAQSFFLDKK